MNVLDIIGPVMIGPSSSHTAGACRIGYITRKLLAQEPVSAEIDLAGSFAKTYRGHGTDRAIVAGILGMRPDDLRLPESLTHLGREAFGSWLDEDEMLIQADEKLLEWLTGSQKEFFDRG